MTRLALLFVLFALAGCGNKGPLLLPDPAAADAVQPVASPLVVPPTEPAAPEPAAPEPASVTEPSPSEPVPDTSGTPAR